MTSDTPTDAGSREQVEASTAAQPPRKPARRRATRAAAAPKGEAAPGAAAPEPTAPEPAAPEAAAPEAAPAAPEQATTAAAPAAASRADIVLPERSSAPDDAPAGAASLSDIVLPQRAGGRAGEADDAADAAPQKPARTRRRATRATGAQRTEGAPAAPEPPAAATPEVTPDAEPEQQATAPKGRKRAATTRSRRAAEPGTTEAPASEPSGTEPAGAEPTAPAKSAAKKAPAKKAAAKSGARKSAAATDATSSTGTETSTETGTAPKGRRSTAAEPATNATAGGQSAEQTAEQSAPRSPAARGGGSVTPRLATTAVLFQAPDLSGRRSRRAQAPAGPPRPHDTPMFAAPEQAPAAEQTETTPSAPERSSRTAKTTGEAPSKAPRARRSTRSAAQAAPAATRSDDARAAETGAAETPAVEPAAVETPAVGAEVDEARIDAIAIEATAAEAAPADLELSEDEVAAVEEVGVIESELVAEGIELVDLGPEDLDDEDAEDDEIRPRRRRRRGGRGRRGGRRGDGEAEPGDEGSDESESAPEDDEPSDERGDDRADERGDERADESEDEGGDSASGRRRRRRRRGTRAERAEAAVARTRDRDEVTALKGSTRLEAKRQRRREGRDAGRRRQIITESEFLARREAVTRSMVVRERDGRTQIAVLEDGVLVEHYVSQQSQASMVGNVYLGRVQNVLPSMEAAFVDVGKGRNAVLYAGEVNWDAAGLEGQPRRIEEALKSGDSVLVQVTKDPIGHKGARLTSQVTLAGRYLVFVPGGGMTGISRKLPDTERSRLKKILRDVVPEGAGVIVRTAAEGASETELRADVERLEAQWASIEKKSASASAPALLQGEPDLAIRVVRDIFNDDFTSLQIQGGAWDEISQYVDELAPDLRERVTKWTENTDVFAVHRVDEQLAKGMDRKVWLPSGGSLVIDRTEAMTVIDVNTGKFTGAGGTLEETVTRNNLEAAEEIVRQLRLRDIGGIVVIDFIDMVLESNRDLVLRRLVECLGRDRTKHQVAEVTSLGLVQMTRKRVGQGLVEAFSETCEHCKGRGFIVHSEPIEKGGAHQHGDTEPAEGSKRSRRKRGGKQAEPAAAEHAPAEVPTLPEDRSEAREAVKATLATIAAAAAHAHEHDEKDGDAGQEAGREAGQHVDQDAGQDAGHDGGHDAVAAPAEAAPERPARVSPDSVIELPERGDEPAARKGAGTTTVPEPGAGEAAEQGLTDS